MILEMEPLTDAKLGRISGKFSSRKFWAAVFANKAHIKVPVIRRPFRFPVPRRRRPSPRQVEKAVPMDTRGFPN